MRPSAKAANSEAPKGLRAFGAHRHAVGALPHIDARFCRGTASNPYRGSWSEAPAGLASGLEVGAVPCGIVERALSNLSTKGVLHDWLLPWEFPTPFGSTSVTRGDNAQLYELFPLN